MTCGVADTRGRPVEKIYNVGIKCEQRGINYLSMIIWTANVWISNYTLLSIKKSSWLDKFYKYIINNSNNNDHDDNKIRL